MAWLISATVTWGDQQAVLRAGCTSSQFTASRILASVPVTHLWGRERLWALPILSKPVLRVIIAQRDRGEKIKGIAGWNKAAEQFHLRSGVHSKLSFSVSWVWGCGRLKEKKVLEAEGQPLKGHVKNRHHRCLTDLIFALAFIVADFKNPYILKLFCGNVYVRTWKLRHLF